MKLQPVKDEAAGAWAEDSRAHTPVSSMGSSAGQVAMWFVGALLPLLLASCPLGCGDPIAPQPGLEAEISPGGASSELLRVGSCVFLPRTCMVAENSGYSKHARPRAGPGLTGASASLGPAPGLICPTIDATTGRTHAHRHVASRGLHIPVYTGSPGPSAHYRKGVTGEGLSWKEGGASVLEGSSPLLVRGLKGYYLGNHPVNTALS